MPSAKTAISIEESLFREATALVKKLSTASFLGILGADSSNGKDRGVGAPARTADGARWWVLPGVKRSGPDPVGRFVRHAHAMFLGTPRNTGNRGDTRSNSASGASLSTGRCGLAPGARFK